MPATANLDTPTRSGDLVTLPVKAATVIYGGTLVAVDGSGNALPAADAANLKVVGRAEHKADNSAGAAGAVAITVARGVFLYANSTAAAVDPDDKFKVCYVEDDQTVAETGGTNSIKAGLVLDVTSEGVWVDTRLAQAL